MMPGLTNLMGKIKPPPKVITFAGSTHDINLRTVYTDWYGYPAPKPEDTVLFIINPGVYIGASSTGAWALQLGWWGEMDVGGAVAPTLNMIVHGRIQGHGGQGGGANGGGGNDGGPAFHVGRSINLVTAGAQIFAGGGGGGATYMPSNGYWFNGGGGCGYNPGAAGVPNFYTGNSFWHAGTAGTTESGGTGFRADNNGDINQGNGGGPGQAGQAAQGDNPGYVTDYGGGGTNWAIYGWGNCRFGNWDYTKQEFVLTNVHGADIRGNLA